MSHRIIAAAAVFALTVALAACGQNGGAAAAQGEETGGVGVAIGDPSAPVTLIEFASVTCPHCAAWHKVVYPEIKRDYVETGKVRFEFRELPTAPAVIAYAGFHLARCSAEDGGAEAYFAMLDALYRAQRTILTGSNPGGELRRVAFEAGFDDDSFTTCLESQEVRDRIQAAVDTSDDFGVTGTPAFIINGELLSGARDGAAIRDALDAALGAEDVGEGDAGN